LVWTGKTPPEILEMRALSDGFELVFTQPMDRRTASNPQSYRMSSYTYQYHSAYGSDEIDTKELSVQAAQLSDDLLSVRLTVDGLRPLYVHELSVGAVRTVTGQPLLHSEAYYTLNRIPN
jgi:hypothetical protein